MPKKNWIPTSESHITYPLRMLIIAENPDRGLDPIQLCVRMRVHAPVSVCVCTCVGSIWRGREMAFQHMPLLWGDTLLCLKGLQCLYLVSRGSNRSEGRNGETYWTQRHFDFVTGSSCLRYSSLCLESLIQRERHTWNKFSQLDTKQRRFTNSQSYLIFSHQGTLRSLFDK